MAKKYWLMKSEPEVFSIDDLKKEQTTLWEGVRNYQARNFMMNDMSIGDEVLFYHSNANPPGIAGIAKISRQAVPDPSAINKKSEYYDEKASKEKPIWFCVEVRFVKKFSALISLDQLRKITQLKNMVLLQKGSRLSVQPVSPAEFQHICQIAEQ